MSAALNVVRVSAISLKLIRAHVSLIHRLAEPPKGRGKIVIACFGQTPDQVAVELGSARSGPLRVLRGRVSGRQQALVAQTTAARCARWREFLQRRWQGSEIPEVMPVHPSRKLRAFITPFDRKTIRRPRAT